MSDDFAQTEGTAGPKVETGPATATAEAAEAGEAAEAAVAAGTDEAAGAPETTGGGRKRVDKATVFKFAGLIAFVAIMAVIVAVAWPYIADVFSEGGVDRLVERVRNAGPAGVLILLGMQFLQIVVAFIPGEVVQLAAGLMYGPWLGALIVLVGCVISSSVIYKLVHVLGAPFVQGMVSTEHLEKFHAFEKQGKLDVIVFILFLIPAMPKDVFTYLVPLTDMSYKKFIIITTVGRIPGVLASTYAAAGLANGDIVGPAVVIGIVAVIAVVVVIFRDRIMQFLGRGYEQ